MSAEDQAAAARLRAHEERLAKARRELADVEIVAGPPPAIDEDRVRGIVREIVREEIAAEAAARDAADRAAGGAQ